MYLGFLAKYFTSFIYLFLFCVCVCVGGDYRGILLMLLFLFFVTHIGFALLLQFPHFLSPSLLTGFYLFFCQCVICLRVTSCFTLKVIFLCLPAFVSSPHFLDYIPTSPEHAFVPFPSQPSVYIYYFFLTDHFFLPVSVACIPEIPAVAPLPPHAYFNTNWHLNNV